ncbi:MAG TPA: ADOP family duplicated permease [Vicinamibacterales bacterium]|nr:ADOP family duplicated permease [Vicinamibacterales bacterium]
MIRALREAWSRLAAIVRRRRWDQDFDEELSTHLALLTERNQRRGLTEAEARRRAILQVGGLSPIKELHRDARGFPRAEQLLQACTHAWKSWRSARGVGLVASAALAVGIGSATAIYSVVNVVMLKPLPYPDGDRFVALFAADLDDPKRHSPLRSQDAERFRDRNRAFDAFGWFRGAEKNLMVAGHPYHVGGVAVTISLVQSLGVSPAVGQWFQDNSGVVISTSLWHRLGGSSAIIGQTVTLDEVTYTVTGVMPDSFRLPVGGMTSTRIPTDVWIPLDPRERAGTAYFAYGRRRPEVPFAAAEADVRRVAAEIAAEDAGRRRGYAARVIPLRETVSRQIRPTLALLLGAAGLLFLITCASAAGLLLARSVARAPETALRVALGAGTWRLIAHYLAETLLVSLVGAVGGVLLSVTLTPAIMSMAADYVPRADEISVDGSVLLFALAAACLASVLSSVTPLWQASRIRPADVLGDGVRSSAGARSRQASQSLVVVEIALAFALLTMSAVLIFHVRNLARTSPGFEPDHVLSFVVSLPGAIANDPGTRVPLTHRLIEAVEAIPGVEEVGFANPLPMKGCCWSTSIHPDRAPVETNAAARASLMVASAGYFRTMRIPLRRGQFFTEDDGVRTPEAIPVVVSETAAKDYWGDLDPVGAYGRFDSATGTRFQVVGVVGDVKNDGLDNPTVPEIYRPALYSRVETMRFVVRSARPEASLIADVRRQVRSVDPTQPIHDVAAMQTVIQNTMTLEHTVLLLTTLFACAALLMAMLGVYGVVSYSVRLRTVEIGMRMALGATGGGVFAMIVGNGLRTAAYGVVTGGAAAFAAVFYLAQVFELAYVGPAPFISTTAIVAALTFAASFLPAWRATLMSPLVAIRNRP